MFFVYENWIAKGHYAKVHRGACGCCNGGQGLTTGTRADNGKWLDPYQSFEEAWEIAISTEAEASVFGNCLKFLERGGTGMPRSRKIEPFYLVIIDDDYNIFNVVDRLTSDRDWNRQIVDLRDIGRNVRCFSHPGTYSTESIINMISNGGRYRFSKQLIVEEPEDTSAEYARPLPDYARNADRRRVVKILCRGRCGGKSRWAESLQESIDCEGSSLSAISAKENSVQDKGHPDRWRLRV